MCVRVSANPDSVSWAIVRSFSANGGRAAQAAPAQSWKALMPLQHSLEGLPHEQSWEKLVLEQSLEGMTLEHKTWCHCPIVRVAAC